MGSWGRSNIQFVQRKKGAIHSLRLKSLSGNRHFIPFHTSTEDQMLEIVLKNLPKIPNDCKKIGFWVNPQGSPTHLSPWQITTSKRSRDLVYILHWSISLPFRIQPQWSSLAHHRLQHRHGRCKCQVFVRKNNDTCHWLQNHCEHFAMETSALQFSAPSSSNGMPKNQL